MSNTQENNLNLLTFAAIDKTIVSNIPHLTQDEVRGKSYIAYGDNNLWPQYLYYNLYQEVTTLKTIIDGTSSYVAGDDARINAPGFETVVNRKGDTVRNIIKWIARDYYLYGGFAIEVIRNLNGKVGELYYTDFKNLRSDKKNEAFWYSEEYDKKYVRTTKTLVYPKYIIDGEAPTSIVYVKNDVGATYPTPRWSGAIRSAEVEKAIDSLHLNSLANGFMGSYWISLNNGIPTDEQKAQIEKDVVSKFGGAENAGRIVISYANSEENAPKIEKLDITDFGDKYKAAADRSREQIYCAFQAIPQLFGNMAAATGFNEVEFQKAWDLYNRTVVRDTQRVIGDAFDHIFGMKDSLTIKPFSIEENNDEQTVN